LRILIFIGVKYNRVKDNNNREKVNARRLYSNHPPSKINGVQSGTQIDYPLERIIDPTITRFESIIFLRDIFGK
jgi:hypothetical protein